MTPSTAVKAMEDAISSPSAPITGATAAIAELPQMELPQATRIAMRRGSPRRRLMAKLVAMATATTTTIPSSSFGSQRQDGSRADGSAKHDDRDLQQHLGAEGDTRVPARPGRPGCPNGDAEKDGENERFEIGLSGKSHFHKLKRARRSGDQKAEQHAWV